MRLKNTANNSMFENLKEIKIRIEKKKKKDSFIKTNFIPNDV